MPVSTTLIDTHGLNRGPLGGGGAAQQALCSHMNRWFSDP